MTTYLVRTALVAACVTLGSGAQAASYIFAGDANGTDVVAHPQGYTGAGGNLNVRIGIRQDTAFSTQMQVSIQNAVNTFNAMMPTLNNVLTGLIPSNAIDFESVFLHELGHSLGLGHTNLASESGLPTGDQSYAVSTTGANGTYDINPGADGVRGTSDDVRGDDENLIYFKKGSNDPFDTNLGVVDSTTYTRDLSELPTGDLYPNIASREAASVLGYGNSEAVMVQGTSFGEVQRTLGAQNVVGLLYAQSGLDSLAGTADDYTLTLEYVGLYDPFTDPTAADIRVAFNNDRSDFAVSYARGVFLSGDDVAITTTEIVFNEDFNWYFNQESNMSPVPLPASLWGVLFGMSGFAMMRRRAGKAAEKPLT